MKLYLDDLRPIPEGHIGVRSYTEFITYITDNGLPDFISIVDKLSTFND